MKICMLVTNSVTADPRVRREASALAEAGDDVVVIGVRGAGDAPEERLDGFRVRRLRLPPPLHIPTPHELFHRGRGALDELRNASLRTFAATAPGAYGSLRELYLDVRHGGKLPAPPPAPPPEAPPPERSEGGFPAASIGRDLQVIRAFVRLNRAIARLAREERADVYHAHDVDTLLAAHLARTGTSARLVYDFHEIYIEQYRPGTRTALWTLYHEQLERTFASRADLRLTVCDSLGAWLQRRYGIGPTTTVRNVPTTRPPPSRPPVEQGSRTVLYHGIYVPDRGLEQLVESFALIRGARLVMRGFVNPYQRHLAERVRSLGLGDRVEFAPPVPMTELIESAGTADIGVAPFLPACLNTYYCLPNKLFEYLMAGLAIAATDLPEIRRVVTERQVGVLFDPTNPRAIAAGIQQLVDDEDLLRSCRQNALAAARTDLNWEAERGRLLEAYAGLRR